MIFNTISNYNDTFYMKILYIWGLAGRRYLFSYPKYEAGYVPAAWPVVGTCFLTQNMKPGMYLRPG